MENSNMKLEEGKYVMKKVRHITALISFTVAFFGSIITFILYLLHLLKVDGVLDSAALSVIITSVNAIIFALVMAHQSKINKKS